MKKILILFIITLTLFITPNTVKALTYDIESADTTISFKYEWFVFTRDNIKNNSELDELEIPYNDMYDFMLNNKAYIVGYYDTLEFLLRINDIDNESMYNLSNYEDTDVDNLGKEITKNLNIENYEIYKNNYKFIRTNYYDNNYSKHIIEYYTVINAKAYTFTIQKSAKFSEEEITEIKNIIDSIEFKIDSKYETEPNGIKWEYIISKAIIGAIAGGLIGGITFMINKIKKNNSKDNNQL